MITRLAHRRSRMGRSSFGPLGTCMQSGKSSHGFSRISYTDRKVKYEKVCSCWSDAGAGGVGCQGAGVAARAGGVSDVWIESSAGALSAWARGAALVLV